MAAAPSNNTPQNPLLMTQDFPPPHSGTVQGRITISLSQQENCQKIIEIAKEALEEINDLFRPENQDTETEPNNPNNSSTSLSQDPTDQDSNKPITFEYCIYTSKDPAQPPLECINIVYRNIHRLTRTQAETLIEQAATNTYDVIVSARRIPQIISLENIERLQKILSEISISDPLPEQDKDYLKLPHCLQQIFETETYNQTMKYTVVGILAIHYTELAEPERALWCLNMFPDTESCPDAVKHILNHTLAKIKNLCESAKNAEDHSTNSGAP